MALPQTFALACLLLLLCLATSFTRPPAAARQSRRVVAGAKANGDYEYSNPITKALEAFLPAPTASNSPIAAADVRRPKRRKTSLKALANDLNKALSDAEWFVTGKVDTTFFADDFRFQDPDVKVTGIMEYAKGVRKLFDQSCTRGEIISVTVSDALPNTITVTWRLEGKVNIGFGVSIKAFVVYTNLEVDSSSGLVVFQEDKFSLPSYDILLSAFLPFLTDIGLLAPPAPAADFLRKTLR